jgi:hypothetical protein
MMVVVLAMVMVLVDIYKTRNPSKHAIVGFLKVVFTYRDNRGCAWGRNDAGGGHASGVCGMGIQTIFSGLHEIPCMFVNKTKKRSKVTYEDIHKTKAPF